MRLQLIQRIMAVVALAGAAGTPAVEATTADAVSPRRPYIVELRVSMPGVADGSHQFTIHLVENEPGVIRLFDRDLALAIVASVTDRDLGDVTLRVHRLSAEQGRFHYRDSAAEIVHARVGFSEYLREGGVFELVITGISAAPVGNGPAAAACQEAGGETGMTALVTEGNCCVTMALEPVLAGRGGWGTEFGACGCLVAGEGGSCCSPRCCP